MVLSRWDSVPNLRIEGLQTLQLAGGGEVAAVEFLRHEGGEPHRVLPRLPHPVGVKQTPALHDGALEQS